MRLKERSYHQRGETIMTQVLLPYQYEEEKNKAGANAPLRGLAQVNREMVAFVQSRHPKEI